MDKSSFIIQLNQWGKERVPFLFLVDFEMEKLFAAPLNKIDPQKILFDFRGFTNAGNKTATGNPVLLKNPISEMDYQKKFNEVMGHLNRGNTFLTNLTIKTEIKSGMPLREMYFAVQAKYKMFYANSFLVFSPETFVRIENDRIYSYPMKGTIDASIPNAREMILNDQKEFSEHVTIVDLIRNDLSQVAKEVTVTNFRYVETLKTSHKTLLQVSSEIVGTLEVDHWSKMGDLLIALLPAGSVSGAPKARTLEIIRHAEGEKRGYYTGVVGYFDGNKLDSGVMIRFIEQMGDKLYYRSGGGITTQSIASKEYHEAIDKVYVPLD